MSSVLGRLAKHAAIYAVADILAKIVGFILLPLYSRKLSAAEYGILAIIQIMNTFPNRLVSQGINTSSMKAITLDYADDPVKRRISLSTAYYYLIGSALVMNLCLFLTMPAIAGWALKTQAYNKLLVCSFVTSVLETSQMIPLQVLLRARFRSVFYSALAFCEFLGSVSLNIYFIVFRGLGISGIIYADLIMAFVIAVAAFFVIRPELVRVFSWPEVGRMVRYGWPLLPARVSMWLLDFADRFQLQRLSTTVEVGLYSVGAKYARIFQFLYLVQFEKVWPSIYFPLAREKDAARQFARVFSYLFLGACSLGIAVILFIDPCIRLTLQRSYWRASLAAPWLIAGFILEMTYQVFSSGLRVTNNTRYLPLVVGSGAAFNIIANLWVLPRWGMVGAAFTTFSANGVLVVMSYFYSDRYYPIHYEWGRLGKIAGLFTVVWVADATLSPADIWVGIPLKALGLALFFLGLRALKVIEPNEIQYFAGALQKLGLKTRRAVQVARGLSAGPSSDPGGTSETQDRGGNAA
jgi:O-antigen/teichoic acid export membrane protein